MVGNEVLHQVGEKSTLIIMIRCIFVISDNDSQGIGLDYRGSAGGDHGVFNLYSALLTVYSLCITPHHLDIKGVRIDASRAHQDANESVTILFHHYTVWLYKLGA